MSLFNKHAPQTLRALAALTGSFVETDPIAVDNDSMVSITVDFTKGTGGTGLELVPEKLMQGSSTWEPVTLLNTGTPASGAVAVEMLAATYELTVTGVRSIDVPVYGASKVRVRVREAGGPSPFGSCSVTAVRSRPGA